MGALALWLKSKLLGNSLSWVFIGVILFILLIIVIPNMDQIKERFGFETRTSLKVKVQEQQHQIDEIAASNEDLKNTIVVNEAVTEKKEEAVEKHTDTVQEASKQVEQIVVEQKKQIKKIKYSAKVNNIDTKTVEKDISKVRITSIWSTYCKFNDNKTCPNTGDVV